MPTMDVDVEVPAFLQETLESAPEQLQEYFLRFEDLWERKLWKQLTDLLTEFYARPDTNSYRMKVYSSFILNFSKHINQLKLVAFGISAVNEYQEPKLALTFMQELMELVDTSTSRDAYVFATIHAARTQLLLGDVTGARTSTQKAGEVLDTFDSVDPVIHAAYYRVGADYHKAKAEYTAYYRQALLYLACAEMSELSLPEKQERAYDLSIAALLGDSIYNFGELLLHPILDSLTNTPHAWLRPFLAALNAGDMAQFESLLVNVSKQPLLSQSLSFLRQKICLMALIEAIFSRPPHDRILPFQTIATETRLPFHEVEHLVMKALSLKLMKGSIDQVDSCVRVTWVQPRVLNLEQIDAMRIRLAEWSAEVSLLFSQHTNKQVKSIESHMYSHSSSFIEVA